MGAMILGGGVWYNQEEKGVRLMSGTKTNEAPRECILKLGQMITDRIGHKVTVDDPEYWGLACVVTDEMAEVALMMKVRKPLTFEQLMKATGKSKEELEPIVNEMCIVGML